MSTTATATPDIEAIAARAAAAAGPYAATSPVERARALVAVADALTANADELVGIAQRETGLTEARLRGELKRTAVQLRLFADTIVDGTYLDVRIDPADQEFALGPRPDVRRYHVPVGPIVNFAASNFPFAFSVAGGDTAAALAAGCPVVLKAHSGHPELSRRTAEVVADALSDAGMPDGVFQLIAGQEAGVAMLKDPRIRAGSFTGSIPAGRRLADIAAARPAPIPFFGELGSVNPVFVTAAAIEERRDEIAAGYVTSVSGSAGQLCTKPGFLFVPEGHGLDQAIVDAAAPVGEHRLLNPRIAEGYGERRSEVLAAAGVRTVVEGAVRVDDDGQGWVTPTIVAVGLADLVAGRDVLLEECFGPFSIIVEYPEDADLAAIVPSLFQGNLTATVHAGHGEADDRLRALVAVLAGIAGRVLFGGWPTGVAVTPAMQHGGPWPATTNDSSTSVGTAAISRFLRPVAYQGAADELLPVPLQGGNPWGVPQRVSPAGESTRWGERVAPAGATA
ncbi:aldehyde dehydrogenase (NADP(+)) [Agromyces aerolatus]|uniref:aldehyde dehydrogenase (NADP(+)) n=1 Tax=Agromyces sp. LY-1074 TaxID=3074080 RepID=UPI0028647A54|nr:MULTISPECIES: aldehyde dehydrogenase (NADP(+)) [unclassified Agromyces]MDR5701568.1 aldehyde dehydrogenase (NADP(+)) [Agromyces sp. LY-1074]MDR5707825.1 aldehyde dehydrogenase (NADP(+)) [Agromyces sp. LY-1358]